MEKKVLWIGFGLMALLVMVAAIMSLTEKASFKGVVISPAPEAHDIKLTDQNSQPFELFAHKGKVTLIYFGYTNCPDECPLTMAKLKLVKGLLGDRSSEVEVIMVTTDPARDTPEKMKGYLQNFDPAFVGLTGSASDLEKVWKDYGVVVENGGETHSDRVYVIDQKGRLRLTFPFDMSGDDIKSDISQLLQEE